MFWLNIHHPIGMWKLHKESCKFSKPTKSNKKGVNKLLEFGGWIHFDSVESAHIFFNENHRPNEFWQPCKVCKPTP